MSIELTDEEREALAAWWASDWPRDESDVLDTLAAAVERIVAARVSSAWDEGFDAGERDVWEHEQVGWRDDHPCIPNPYRAALSSHQDQP